MKRWLMSGTSILAFAVLGCGRAGAVPAIPVTNGLLTDTIDRSDVVRQSLSVGAQTPGEARSAVPPDAPSSSRPTIADVSAQTPTATFTWRPAVAVRGDAGPVGMLAAGGSRNPGNISNLTGTVGGDPAGIFAVPATAIAVNGAVEHESDYLFRPVGAIESLPSSTELVPPERGRDHPHNSVFIGTPPAFGDVAAERAAREASIVSATGSAAPTVRITPLPGQPAAAGTLAYQVDTGLTTTIGFSTASLPPTALPLGAAATSTLGYTYRPFSAAPRSPVAAVGEQTLSATITAPDGTLARRSPDGARAGAPPTRNTVIAPPTVRSGVAEAFPVESYPLPDGAGGIRKATLPIAIGDVPGSVSRSDLALLSGDESDNGQENPLLIYALIAVAVTVPPGLAILAHRLVRRAALRQLGEFQPPA